MHSPHTHRTTRIILLTMLLTLGGFALVQGKVLLAGKLVSPQDQARALTAAPAQNSGSHWNAVSGVLPWRSFDVWEVLTSKIGGLSAAPRSGFAPKARAASSMMFATTATNFPANSYIINMGIATQTVANGLKPYGLIYALVKTNQVPVYWAINDTKGYDGIDFSFNPGTPNVVRDYKSGAFIISGDYVNASVISTINTWKAKGVVVDGPTTAPMTNIPIYDTITYFPNSALNSTNNTIAADFYVAAEIPNTAYAVKAPSALGNCDDLFIMPHADPTWATHSKWIYLGWLPRGQRV